MDHQAPIRHRHTAEQVLIIKQDNRYGITNRKGNYRIPLQEEKDFRYVLLTILALPVMYEGGCFSVIHPGETFVRIRTTVLPYVTTPCSLKESVYGVFWTIRNGDMPVCEAYISSGRIIYVMRQR